MRLTDKRRSQAPPRMIANSQYRTPERQAEIAARKDALVNVLTLWVRERRADERMDRDQLAGLDSLGRLQAQRQSLLDNYAHFYAEHPNADVAPGVLLLVTIFSDNNTGCCSLSVTRMAAFLSRSTRRVSDAIARLEDKQLIAVERALGETSRTFPWVHKSFGSTKDALTWILDVRAPALQRGIAGRPAHKNTPDAGVTPISRTPDAGDVIPLTPVTDTPDAGDVIPLTLASANTTKLNTTNNKTQGRDARLRNAAPNSFEIESRSEGDGARYLWQAMQAECFPFPPRNAAAAAWQSAADAEPGIAHLTREQATTIAREAKRALQVASQRGVPEWPGVGDVVRQIDGHIAHALALRQRVADWDAETARIAVIDRDEPAVESIRKLYPEPLWIDGAYGKKTRAAVVENEMAFSAALVAAGLTVRGSGDRYRGEGMGPRPSEDLPPFVWQITTAKSKAALDSMMAIIEGGR